MTMRTLELEILHELRAVAKKPRLRLRDICEWTSGKMEKRPGETIYYLARIGISAAIKEAKP